MSFNSPEAQKRREQKNLSKKLEKFGELIASFRTDYPHLAYYEDKKILDIIDEINYKNYENL